jgi:hypothetical protein
VDNLTTTLPSKEVLTAQPITAGLTAYGGFMVIKQIMLSLTFGNEGYSNTAKTRTAANLQTVSGNTKL